MGKGLADHVGDSSLFSLVILIATNARFIRLAAERGQCSRKTVEPPAVGAKREPTARSPHGAIGDGSRLGSPIRQQ